MKSILQALLFSLVCGGCSYHVFPSNVLNGVEQNFDFARWRMVPSQVEPTRVELGGRILETQTIGGTITIVTTELPVVHYPAYGPKQGKRKSKGDLRLSIRA